MGIVARTRRHPGAMQTDERRFLMDSAPPFQPGSTTRDPKSVRRPKGPSLTRLRTGCRAHTADRTCSIVAFASWTTGLPPALASGPAETVGAQVDDGIRAPPVLRPENR